MPRPVDLDRVDIVNQKSSQRNLTKVGVPGGGLHRIIIGEWRQRSKDGSRRSPVRYSGKNRHRRVYGGLPRPDPVDAQPARANSLEQRHGFPLVVEREQIVKRHLGQSGETGAGRGPE